MNSFQPLKSYGVNGPCTREMYFHQTSGLYVPVWKRSVSTSWIEKFAAAIPAERFMHEASGKPTVSSSTPNTPSIPVSSS